MARGWDSKSVEAQIQDSQDNHSGPGDSNSPQPRELERQQRRASLLLARQRTIQQMEASNNERYGELLRRTLADLDSQLQSE